MGNKAPLTQTQLGIYFESIMHEGEAFYNTPKLFRLDSSPLIGTVGPRLGNGRGGPPCTGCTHPARSRRHAPNVADRKPRLRLL